jgi:tetratricopeptide (TPR) repeat protein
MGKNKVLDLVGDSTIMRNTLIKRVELFYFLLFTLCSSLFFIGCSFPRIIVLKDPLTPEEHLNLGVAYEKKGEFENAIKEYKLAAKEFSIAYLYLGNVYFQKSELSEAEKYYKRSIKKEPNNADAYNNLAWLYYIKRENLDKAETLALRAMELNSLKIQIYRDTLEKVRKAKMTIK